MAAVLQGAVSPCIAGIKKVVVPLRFVKSVSRAVVGIDGLQVAAFALGEGAEYKASQPGILAAADVYFSAAFIFGKAGIECGMYSRCA